MKKLLAAALLALSLAGCAHVNGAPPRTTPTSPPRNEIAVKVPIYPLPAPRLHTVPKPVIPKLPYKPTIPDVHLRPSLPAPALPHPSLVSKWQLYYELLRDRNNPSAIMRDVAPGITQVLPQAAPEPVPAEHHRFRNWAWVLLCGFLALGGAIWWHERKPVVPQG